MTFFIAIICGGYCFWDAHSRRMKNPWLWSLFGGICNLFAIAIMHGNRWLKQGETRSGGRGWDSCRWFAICSTIFFFFSGIAGMVSIASDESLISASEAEQAGAAIGTTLGIGLIFFLWLFVAGAALIVGLMLKKDTKEIGPTGPLSTRT